MRFWLRKWYVIVAGIALTALAVKQAYATRGYIAYGGEWLVLPLLMIITLMIEEAKRAIPEMLDLFREED